MKLLQQLHSRETAEVAAGAERGASSAETNEHVLAIIRKAAALAEELEYLPWQICKRYCNRELS